MQENPPTKMEEDLVTPDSVPPQKSVSQNQNTTKGLNFTGFWKRVAIYYVDISVISLLSILIHPMAMWVGVLANIVLYFMKGMTLGDFVMQTKLVDFATYQKPRVGQLIGRFFAKIISAIPFSLGFMWAGWAKEKKAWHDGMSGTRYIETKTYTGGITWLANILLLIVLPYFTMQPVISFVTSTIVPIGQGIFEGNPEKELEGINSFGDTLEQVAREQMEKIEETEERSPTKGVKRIATPVSVETISKTESESEEGVVTETDSSEKVMVSGPEDHWTYYYIANNKVYYRSYGVGNVIKDSVIEGADAKTFEAIGTQFWAKDKRFVYSEGGLVVEGADINTIEVLDTTYAKDSTSVFYGTRKVEGADVETFEVDGWDVFDKNNTYKYGKIVQ